MIKFILFFILLSLVTSQVSKTQNNNEMDNDNILNNTNSNNIENVLLKQKNIIQKNIGENQDIIEKNVQKDDPEEDPKDPEEDPKDPEEEPKDPEEEPKDPEEEPEEDPKEDPEEDPKDPEEDPKYPEEDPKDPEEDPKDPEEDPKDPEEDPKDPEEDPKDPEEDPKDPEEDPKDPEEDPEDPEDPQINCGIFGQRIFLGDYFTQKKDKLNMFTVGANIQDGCGDLYLLYSIGSNQKRLIVPVKTITIDTKEFTNKKSDYIIHTSFFYIPYKESMDKKEFIEYAVYQKDDKDEDIEFFKVKLPNHQDGELNSILVYGDYDANVQDKKTKEDNTEDMGQHTHDYIVKQVKDVTKNEYELTLFLGDLAYDIQDDNYKNGENYFRKTTEYNAAMPYMSTYGNHDSGGKDSDYGYQFMEKYFYMPNYVKGKNNDYHFFLKKATFINLQASSIWYNKPEEKDAAKDVISRFKDQLENAKKNRKEKPWIIVYSHYPIYYTLENDTEDKFQPNRELFKEIETLLNKYEVDLYLSAHVHAYQRFQPLNDGKECEQTVKQETKDSTRYYQSNCPMYVVEGLGGQRNPIQTENYKVQDIMEFQDVGEAGVGKLTIHNSKQLQYQHIRTSDGKVIDEFWLDKGEPKSLGAMVIFGILLSAAVLAGLSLYMLWRWKKQSDAEKAKEKEGNNDLESNKKDDIQQELVQQNTVDLDDE